METREDPTAHPDRVIVVPATGSQVVQWVIAGLLAVIALILVTRWDGGGLTAPARAQDATRVGARGIHAFTGQLSKTTYGLFMMDVDSATIWCYEYVPQTRRLRLVAARSWQVDRYLEEFNVDSPTPGEVAQLVEKQRSNRKVHARAAAPATDR